MPKDAVHLATALTSEAHYLETFDGGLIGKSRLVGGDPQLVIQIPGADLTAKAAAANVKAAQTGLEFPDMPGHLSS